MSLDGRFRIDQAIHVGQIATSYPAQCRESGQKVLLKVIHPQLTGDQELVERFRREGKTMESVNHPHVVKLLEFGEDDGVPFLALEWVDGGTLADAIKSGPLSQDVIRKIAKDVLAGLDAVHGAGILHRDLKPDNILLTSDSRAKLADFSLVGFDNFSGLTQHGAIVGSPAFMAPELLDGVPATPQSDLYGIGIILFEALIGSNPYLSSDPLVSMDLIRKSTLPKLVNRSNIGKDIASLIDSLLERDPIDRPISAVAAIALLEGKEIVLDETSVQSNSKTVDSTAPDISSDIPAKRSQRIGWYFPVAIVIAIVSFFLWLENRDQLDSAVDEPISEAIDSQKDSFPDEIAVNAPIQMDSVAPTLITEFIPSPVVENQSDTPVKLNPGRLTVIAIPWAQVSVDDDSVGITPIGTMELTAGQHTIRFEHISYPSYEQTVEIAPDKSDTLIVHMVGDVNFIADPYGLLSIDGKEIGWLPGRGSLLLSPGMHFVEITHPDLDDWKDSLSIGRGKQLFRINLANGTMIATNY